MAATTDPKIHKALGRKVSNYEQKTWNEHKLRIVEEGNWWKFTASTRTMELKAQLLATGDNWIVEVCFFPSLPIGFLLACSSMLMFILSGITFGQDLGHWFQRRQRRKEPREMGAELVGHRLDEC
jgi:hypothetical protein